MPVTKAHRTGKVVDSYDIDGVRYRQTLTDEFSINPLSITLQWTATFNGDNFEIASGDSGN
jgi:hypothetical protein